MKTKQAMKRRFLLALPVLIYPFLTLLLWSAGVFKPAKATAAPVAKGLNTSVPGAMVKEEKGMDKMGFYMQADKDSIRLKEQMANDPYYKDVLNNPENKTSTDFSKGDAVLPVEGNYKDPNEQKIYDRIAKLQELIHTPAAPSNTSLAANGSNVKIDDASVTHLENMMQHMQHHDTDAQMQQLNSMMDKILDMQHPERVTERMQQNSAKHKGQVFAVSAVTKPLNASLLSADSLQHVRLKNEFYGLNDVAVTDSSIQHTIGAIVQETQTVTAGVTIKFRLTEDVLINGVLIPKNSFVFGIASINGERLQVNIPSVQWRQHLLAVSLSVYDMDGLNGIYIPGSINRDVSKESADQAINGIGLTTLDPSIAAQATSAGIQAAKSLLSKKVKLVKVTLKAGYRVLLKDNNEQH